MQINRLDHVNIRTTQLAPMIAWYVDILGLENGWRPDFGFPGAWLFAGDTAVVHLVAIDGPPAIGSETGLKLEHFTFTARDAAGFEARLTTHGERFEKAYVKATGVTAFNVWDPDGNHIHVDFAAGA